MLILSNIRQLYDGTSAERRAVHTGVDLHVDSDKGRIEKLRPHEPATGTRSSTARPTPSRPG